MPQERSHGYLRPAGSGVTAAIHCFFLWQVSDGEADFALGFSKWNTSALFLLCSFLIVAANFCFLWLHFKLKDLIMLQFRFSVALWKRTRQSSGFKLWWKTPLLSGLKSIGFTAEIYLVYYKQQVMWEVFSRQIVTLTSSIR